MQKQTKNYRVEGNMKLAEKIIEISEAKMNDVLNQKMTIQLRDNSPKPLEVAKELEKVMGQSFIQFTDDGLIEFHFGKEHRKAIKKGVAIIFDKIGKENIESMKPMAMTYMP